MRALAPFGPYGRLAVAGVGKPMSETSEAPVAYRVRSAGLILGQILFATVLLAPAFGGPQPRGAARGRRDGARGDLVGHGSDSDHGGITV